MTMPILPAKPNLVLVLAIVGATACATQESTNQNFSRTHSDAEGTRTVPGARGSGILGLIDEEGRRWVVLSEQQGAALLVVDVTKDPFRLRATAGIERGMAVSGAFSICVAEDGQVAKVKAMRTQGTGDDATDAAWISTMKRWRYRPYLVDGVATRFCTNTRPRVRAE